MERGRGLVLVLVHGDSARVADPVEQLTRTRTSTRPPHPPHPTPCPYRAAYVSSCIRSSTFIRGEGSWEGLYGRPPWFAQVDAF